MDKKIRTPKSNYKCNKGFNNPSKCPWGTKCDFCHTQKEIDNHPITKELKTNQSSNLGNLSINNSVFYL